MKNKNHAKKIVALLALTLSASTLFACTGNQTVSFTHYWAKNAVNAEEQENVAQKLEYAVTFKKSTSTLPYTVEYQNGKYTTELSMLPYGEGKTLVYSYKTALTIDATYTYKGESFTSSDKIETEVLFHSTKNFLKPISSKKTILASTPVNISEPLSVESCYSFYDYVVETTYNEACSKGTTVTTTKKDEKTQSDTKTFSIDDKYTYLDNEQLLFALSGISPSDKQNPKFSVYAPFTCAVQTISVSFSSVQEDVLTFTKNGETKEYGFTYFPVSIKINSNTSGATQTAWYASHNKSPELRNVMLKLEVPVSYNLGTLVYTLASFE